MLLGNFRLHLRNPRLRGLFLQAFLLMGGFVALFNYIGFRLAGAPFGLSSTVIGLLFVVYLAGIFSAGWAGRLVPRFGARNVLRGGVGLMLLGVALCASAWLAAIVLGLGLFTLGFFAAHAVASGQVGIHAEGAKAQASALYLCALLPGLERGGLCRRLCLGTRRLAAIDGGAGGSVRDRRLARPQPVGWITAQPYPPARFG